MSTRATYEFRTDRPSFRREQFEPTFVYKHHDGYPEGAAGHLQCVSELPPLRSNFGNSGPFEQNGKKITTNEAAIFFEANEKRVRDIEFTDSHEIHGDTEYRYIITTYINSVPARLREIAPVKPRKVEVLQRTYLTDLSGKDLGQDEWVTILKCSLKDFVQAAGNSRTYKTLEQIYRLEQELEKLRQS